MAFLLISVWIHSSSKDLKNFRHSPYSVWAVSVHWFCNRVKLTERHKTSRKFHCLEVLKLFTALTTIELQWLEHWWLVYHGLFELSFSDSSRKQILREIFLFYYKIVCCVYSSMRFWWVHATYNYFVEDPKHFHKLSPFAS